MYVFYFFSWVGFCMFVFCLPLYEQTQQMTNWWYFFVIFPENRHWLIFHADYLLGRQNSYFLGKTRKNMSLASAEFVHCMVSVNQVFSVCNSCMYFLSWVVFYMFVFCIPLCVQIQQMTSFFFFLFFSRKWALTFYADCLLGRWFASNDNTCFLGKQEKYFRICWFFSQGAEC